MYRHAPKFLWIVKSEDSKSDVFIELTYLNVLTYGLGLKFLRQPNKFTPFRIEDYVMRDNQIPMVVFPESTKTNRVGVLNIRSNLMDKVYDIVNDHGRILIRSEIAVKKFKYFSPDNTTDTLGLKSLLNTTSQVYNNLEVVVQDIPNNNFDKTITYDRTKYKTIEEFMDSNLQSHLVEPNSRNIVSLTAKDHISFLQYFHETSKDASYVKKGD